MLRALLPFLLFVPAPLMAQSMAGTWLYNGPAGEVRLDVRQEGSAVAGTMIGADGSSFVLDGALEEGGATGSIRIGDGAGWFAMGLVGAGLKLVVAEIDPATGQPDLSSGWELDFSRVGQAGAAPAPPQGMPAPAPATPQTGTIPGVNENSALVQQWLGHLSGAMISYRESYDSSGPGGFGGYQNNWDAWLCSDGTFWFRQSSSTTLDTGGMFGSNASRNMTRGTWRVVEYNGQAVLQYQMDGSAPEYGVLGFENGATWLDRSRIYVTRENPYCG